MNAHKVKHACTCPLIRVYAVMLILVLKDALRTIFEVLVLVLESQVLVRVFVLMV